MDAIFNKPYYPLSYFNYEVFVHCPKCNKLGVIKTDKELNFYPRKEKAQFICFSCTYRENAEKEWHGYYIGYLGKSYKWGACKFCGNPLFKEFEKTKTPYKSSKVTCGVCNKEREYDITWYPITSSTPNDPHMGMELYYQKAIRGNILWVYNWDHLDYLRSYIKSKIRDRESTGFYTLVARLPEFVKLAKNRDIILKALDSFEKEMKNKTA